MGNAHDAKQLGFDRRYGAAPGWVWNLPQGAPIPEPTLEKARELLLKFKGETVLVVEQRQLPDGSFEGTISGFEPSQRLEYQGLRIGDRIQFEPGHVFGGNGGD